MNSGSQAEWINVLIALLIPTIGGIVWIIVLIINSLNQKLESNQKLICEKLVELENDLLEEIDEKSQETTQGFKYSIKEQENSLIFQINNINYLVTNLEQRLLDRSKFAKAKWENLNNVLNDIIKFLKKKGYVSSNLPLDNIDTTLSNKDDIY